MCGNLEGETELESELYTRFLAHARSLLAGRPPEAAAKPNEDLNGYLDRLFADALTRCARDGEAADEGRRYDVLSVQPLAFARLAGFLAGHVALQEDPLRKVMEALMLGYAEAEHLERGHGHAHAHGGHAHPHEPGRPHEHH
jgi:hypothetical protein